MADPALALQERTETPRASISPPATPEFADAPYDAGISLILCTYNRRPQLERMLRSILCQLPTADPIEVIVVDNNSTDDTAEFVRSLASDHHDVVYVHEPRQGVSHARNAGAAAARYGFLLYLDDDAVLPPHYLATLGPLLADFDPDIFGGPILPLFTDPKPDWFPDSLEIRKKKEISGFCKGVSPSGGNYGIRASLLKRIGGFNPAYGMSGAKVGMLEERTTTETYYRLVPESEQKVYYSLEHYILHETSRRRMRLGFQVKRFYIAQHQLIRYFMRNGVRSPRLVVSAAFSAFVWALKKMLGRLPHLVSGNTEDRQRFVLSFMKLTGKVGDLTGALAFAAREFPAIEEQRQSQTPQARPLHVVYATANDANGDACPLSDSAFADRAAVEVHKVRDNKKLRRRLWDIDYGAIDLIVTDLPNAAAFFHGVRPHRPHVQVVMWVTNRAPLRYLRSWKVMWRARKGLLARLAHDYGLYRSVDLIVCRHPRDVAALRRLRIPRERIVLAADDDADASAIWGEIVETARLWAPQRYADRAYTADSDLSGGRLAVAR